MLLMGLVAAAFLFMIIVLDTIPADLTAILIAVLLGVIIITSILLGRAKKWKRIVGVLVAFLFLVAFGGTTYFMADTYATINAISDSGISATGPKAKTIDPTIEPFNVYITGIDQWEEDEGLDLERSDVNMIVTVNPATNKIMLTSIPRDSYVMLHTAQAMDKLTHTGIYGVDETLNTVEDWLDIDINYYVKMNFTAAEDLINAIGGIKVYSPVEFESSLRGYKYKKGWNKLSGRKALYFARERKAFEENDAARIENQQRVMEAIIKRMTSSTTLLTNYGNIMEAAGKNLTTNMSSDELLALVKMQMTYLSSWDIETQKITGDYDMDYVASLTQSQKFSIYRPHEDSVESIKSGINKVMNPPQAEVDAALEERGKSFVSNFVKNMIEKAKMEKVEE